MRDDNRPLVTAVVVNWNRKKDILRLLDSLAGVTYANLQIVVVDNASTDDSVSAIKSHSVPVILLENAENLGGTGGFNSGIRYATTHLQQEFIWLLDNDVTVDPSALTVLVDSLNNDPSIGLAGSCIVNQSNKDAIVETGGIISWKDGNVVAVHRNSPKSVCQNDIIDVDYVAVCSAIIRASALSVVGLMDERYFLLWDDMDWGVSFKKHGYRVVCVSGSVVYHPAFTEKRNVVVDNYYGIRNPLLTLSKHATGIARGRGILSILIRASVFVTLYTFGSFPFGAFLCRKAVLDYLASRWGKLTSAADNSMGKERGLPLAALHGKNILILPAGNGDDLMALSSLVSTYKRDGSRITLLIQKDRRFLFESKIFDEIITYDENIQTHMIAAIRTFIKILLNKYDMGIKPSRHKVTPFSFAVKRTCYYDVSLQLITTTKESVFWLVPFILLLIINMLSAFISFPIVYIKSRTYYAGGTLI